MMHGAEETRDRGQGPWMGPRRTRRVGRREDVSLEGGASLGRSSAQTVDVRIRPKAIVGAEEGGERGNAHRIVPVECLGGLASQSR